MGQQSSILQIMSILAIIFFVVCSSAASTNNGSIHDAKEVFTIHAHHYSRFVDNNSDMWMIETVDSIGTVGWYTSIDIFRDTAYVSYYDIDKGDLRLISGSDTNWSVSVLDSIDDVGMYSSLTIEGQGQIHISYYNKTAGDLKYTTQRNGQWIKETVDTAGDVGYDTSIAVDSTGQAHISYYDKTNGCLKHAWRTTAGWNTEIVDDNGNIGMGSSLSIDKTDHVHVTYTDTNQHILWHAYQTHSNQWVIETVDDQCYVFASTSLDVDSAGAPHVCYYDVPNPTADWNLKYATKDHDEWMVEIIDPNLKYFWNEWGCSLAIDHLDRIHVGYYSWKHWNANYAIRIKDQWQIETVEELGSVGAYASITVDDQGYPHMSYMNLNDFSLIYAKKIQFSPDPPTLLEGDRIGRVGTTYQFQASTSDFDGDLIRFGWDWGDDSLIEWSPYVHSGAISQMNHSWLQKGSYDIQVIAEDIHGHQSLWSQRQEIRLPKQNLLRHQLVIFFQEMIKKENRTIA